MQETSDTDGKVYTVQYFEKAVFERHPENQPPYDVLLSLLGVFRYKQKYPGGAPGQAPNASAGARLFPETGKRVGCEFLDYWERHGGLAQFGYPISDELTEVSELDGHRYRVQYFERTVFEYHQEAIERVASRTLDTVVAQPMGTDRYQAKHSGQLPPGIATPTPTGGAKCAPTVWGPTSTSPHPTPPVRSSVGKGHVLTGVIKSSKDCSPINGARIAFWLAYPNGQYDDDHQATVLADSSGAYRFESNYPGKYEDLPPHIHLYVSADGFRGIETEIFPYCGQTEGTLDVVLEPGEQ